MKIWDKIKDKIWSKPDENIIESLQEIIIKLKEICILKDEAYLIKYQEAENFKKSAYATLAAIALAHGGEYIVDNTFTAVVTGDEFKGKLVLTGLENGLKISVNETGEESL